MTMRLRVTALLLTLTCPAASCRSWDVPHPPAAGPAHSVVVIAVDALATRRMTLYGGPVAVPAIAALAGRGVLFADAATEVPQVRPALASLLTGQPVTVHGVRDDLVDRLGDAVPTLATSAKGAGASTAAFVSSPFASSAGFTRGFDLFDGPQTSAVGPAARVPRVVPAGEIADHFAKWVAAQAASPAAFAFVELADLQGVATRGPVAASQAAYDEKLKEIDAAVGKIVGALDAAPLGKNADVFLVGTHGVLLGEGGGRGDAFWLGSETLRVPLVWAGPTSKDAGAPGSRSERRVTLRDISPTVAAILGASLPSGEDAVPLGASAASTRLRYAWAFAPDDQLAWPPLTAVDRGEGFRVFEPGADGVLRAAPGAPASEDDRAAAARHPALRRESKLSATEIRRLESFGFKIGASGAPPGSAGPKDPNAWLAALGDFRHLVAEGKDRRALKASEELLDGDRDGYAALVARLFVTTLAPDSKDGPALRADLLARYGNRQEALHWSAHSVLVEKKYEAAEALLDAAVAAGPVEPEIYYDRACVLSLRGKTPEAIVELKRAVDAGFREWNWMDRDPDLAAIRSDPGYAEILRTHGR